MIDHQSTLLEIHKLIHMFLSIPKISKKKKRKEDSLIQSNVQVYIIEQVTSFGTNLGHLYLEDHYFKMIKIWGFGLVPLV